MSESCHPLPLATPVSRQSQQVVLGQHSLLGPVTFVT